MRYEPHPCSNCRRSVLLRESCADSGYARPKNHRALSRERFALLQEFGERLLLLVTVQAVGVPNRIAAAHVNAPDLG